MRRSFNQVLWSVSRATLAAAGLALAPTAFAAEDDKHATAEEAQASPQDTIVVTGLREKGTGTGTKTETPLIETPQSITVIDGEELERRNVLSINQALGYVA